jgi:hypothetical protein
MKSSFLRVQNALFAALLVAFCAATANATAVGGGSTITGTFTDYVTYGYLLNYPAVGQLYYEDNTATAVVGVATAAGSACAGANMLCWGNDPGSGIPDSQTYSELVFTGTTTFDSGSSASQPVGTIYYLNGTSALPSSIFGATLNFFDNGVPIGSDSVVISTTANQYSGTGLTQAQLNTDADYVNICGPGSNICADSIESYEDSEGGTGLLVDLTGALDGLVLTNANLDPSQSSCTTCGIVGSAPALGEAPEPPSFVLLGTALIALIGLFCGNSLRKIVFDHTSN